MPLLNLRWFILTIGKKRNGRMTEAATHWLAVIEPMFGALFFVTRVYVYSARMVYQIKDAEPQQWQRYKVNDGYVNVTMVESVPDAHIQRSVGKCAF